MEDKGLLLEIVYEKKSKYKDRPGGQTVTGFAYSHLSVLRLLYCLMSESL